MLVDEPSGLESPAALTGPSELLAGARQRLGLSQKEVADELYLTTSFIEKIDAGEFASIPKPAFIKGYLRAYARVVELSGDEIVALYKAALQVEEPTLKMKGFTQEDVGTASITGPVLQIGLMGLAGFALVVAVIWSLVSDWEEETPLRVAQPGGSKPAEQDSSEARFDFVLPPQERAALQSEQVSQEQAVFDQAGSVLQAERIEVLPGTDAVEPELAQTVDQNREVSVIPIAEKSNGEAAIEQPISEQPTAGQESPGVALNSVNLARTLDGTRRLVTLDAGGFDRLELLFNDECWVEIADNQLGLIYNDLNLANDVLTIYGSAPFKVLLGKATGVEMIYNGIPVELEPFVGRGRTAKLTVPNPIRIKEGSSLNLQKP